MNYGHLKGRSGRFRPDTLYFHRNSKGESLLANLQFSSAPGSFVERDEYVLNWRIVLVKSPNVGQV